MNPTHEPLDERVLDELLSADLDGELAAAAADLGLSVDEARAAISSAAAVARRAALGRASAAVGASVPPLDPDTTARLVTASITEARKDDELGTARRRRERRGDTARRVMVVAGSAAAAIAVIVGLAHMPTSSEDNGSMSLDAPTERAGTDDGSTATSPVALGDVSDTEQLRRRLAAQLRLPEAPKDLASATTVSPQKGSSPLPTGEFSSDSSGRQQYRSARACAPTARAAAGGGAPVLTGRAVSDGRPVTVYVFRRGAAYDVVVVSRDCSVVSRLTLP